jgi:hypothetical protein
MYQCTWCGRVTNDYRELGTVCLAKCSDGLCPGMIDSADKIKKERDAREKKL